MKEFNYKTIEEASQNWCPMARVAGSSTWNRLEANSTDPVDTDNPTCFSHNCAMWVWDIIDTIVSTSNNTIVKDLPFNKWLGHCGLLGK